MKIFNDMTTENNDITNILKYEIELAGRTLLYLNYFIFRRKNFESQKSTENKVYSANF